MCSIGYYIRTFTSVFLMYSSEPMHYFGALMNYFGAGQDLWISLWITCEYLCTILVRPLYWP